MDKDFIIMLIIILLLISIAVTFLFFFIKETNKVLAKYEITIKEINNDIEMISTLEQCETVKTKIKEYYDNTDSLYSSIRQEYIKLYFIVVGIEKTIKKLIKN